MKKSYIITVVSAICIWITVNSAPAFADSQMQVQAATGCFPRVFSQIDQFKSSSGGLRNTHPNPRTIVCSVHINDFETPIDSLLYVGIYFEALQAPTSCTLYLRDGNPSTGNGVLIDSASAVIAAGTKFYGFQGVDRTADLLSYFAYFQCTLPSQGKIFHYNVFNL